jgi:autotransporter-associated beta strand protein
VLRLTNATNDFAASKITMYRGTLAVTSDGALGQTSVIEHYTESINGAFRFDADNITIASTRGFLLTGGANARPFNTQAFTATIAGVISGGGNPTKLGSGTLILTGANSFTAALNVNAGTVQIGAGGTTGSIATASAAVSSGATLAFNRSNALTVSTVISGAGAVLKSGTGTLTLSGANTFSGGLTIADGSLIVNAANGLGSGLVSITNTAGSSTVTIANNAAVTVANNFTLPAPGAARTYNLVKNSASASTGTDLGLNGIISGGNANTTLFFNSSAGGDSTTSYTLSGANTFRATININRGALVVNHLSGLGDAANIVRLDANINGTLGNLRFAVGGTFANPVQLIDRYPVNTLGNNVVLTGVVSGAGGLTKLGAGTLTLTATATYSGVTTVSEGTLRVGNAGTTGALPATNASVASGATLAFNRSDSLTYDRVISGAGAVAVESGTLVLGSSASLTSSLIRVDAGATLNATALSSGISLGSGQRLSGAGTVSGALTLGSGSALATGPTVSTLTLGALSLSGGSSLDWKVVDSGLADWDEYNVASLDLASLSSASRATLNLWSLASDSPAVSGDLANFDATAEASWLFLTSGEQIAGFTSDLFSVNTALTSATGGFSNSLLGGSFSVALSSDGLGLELVFIPGNGLNWSGDGVQAGGSGTWSAAGTNWLLGEDAQVWDSTNRAIFGGTGGTVTVSGALTASDGLEFTADGYSLVGDALALAAATAADNVVSVGTGFTVILANAVTAEAGLTKAGLGELRITGSLSATGGVAIAAGTLRVGAGGSAGTLSGDVALTTGAALVFDRSDAVTFGGAISGAGTVTQSGGNTLTLSGIVSGSNAVTLSSGGLVLSGANSFTGGVTVSAGTLGLGSTAALGGATSRLTIAGGALDNVSGSSLALTPNNPQTWSGNFSFVGTHNLDLGTGTVTLSGNRTVTVQAGKFSVGAIAGGQQLTKAGAGTLALRGASAAMSALSLTEGTLRLETAGALGATPLTLSAGTVLSAGATGTVSGAFTVAGATEIQVDSGITLTKSGIWTLGNTVTKTGAGTLTLTGYTGSTATAATDFIVNAGTLELATGYFASLPFPANTMRIVVNTGGTLLATSSHAIGGSNASGGSLDQVFLDGGTYTLTGSQYFGSGTVNGTGRLTLRGATVNGALDLRTLNATVSTLASNVTSSILADVSLQYGGVTFAVEDGDAEVDLLLSSVIFQNNGMTKTGDGTMVLTADNTYAGTTTVSGGVLQLGQGGTAGGIAGNLSIGTGASLVINRSNTFSLPGTLSGAGTLVQAGSGTLVLGSANAGFSGSLGVESGTVQLGNVGALGTGSVTVTGGTLDMGGLAIANTLIFTSGSLLNAPGSDLVMQLAGTVSALDLIALPGTSVTAGAGVTVDLAGVTKEILITGTPTMSNLGTFSGDFLVEGVLDLSDAGNRPGVGVDIELRTGGRLLAGTTALGGTIAYSGGSIEGNFTGIADVLGTNVALLGSALPSGVVRVGTGASASIGAGFSTDLLLVGTGSVSGLTDYTGTVELGTGALLNTGTESSPLVTAASIVVGANSQLSGNGTLGDVTVKQGGLLAPGNSPGTLTFASLTLEAGGGLDFEIVSAQGAVGGDAEAGIDYDTMVVNGLLDLRGLSAGNAFQIRLISLSAVGPDVLGDVNLFDPEGTFTFNLFTYTGLLGGENLSSLFQIDTTDFTYNGAALDASLFSVVSDLNGTQIQLVYSAIPEPSTYGLAFGLLALASVAVRRRARRHSGTAARQNGLPA